MNTKHADNCKMVFGKKDPTCPRCVELLNGATPRSWGNSLRKENAAQSLKWIKAHNCQKSKCGQVCTFGEW